MRWGGPLDEMTEKVCRRRRHDVRLATEPIFRRPIFKCVCDLSRWKPIEVTSRNGGSRPKRPEIRKSHVARRCGAQRRLLRRLICKREYESWRSRRQPMSEIGRDGGGHFAGGRLFRERESVDVE